MFRCHRLAPACLLGALAISVSACGTKSDGGSKSSKTAEVAKVDIGSDLFLKQPMPKTPVTAISAELITASQAVIQWDQKIQVPSEVDGRIEIMGTLLPADYKFDPTDSRIIRHPRDQSMLFYKLQEMDTISTNQLLVRLDESQILIQLNANKNSLKAFDASISQSKVVVKYSQEIVDAMKKLGISGSTTELAGSIVQLARAEEGLANSLKEREKIAGEVDVATSRLQQFAIKSPVDGRVLKILKNPGEFVKAGEPIMEIQATSRFRVEAKLDLQVANRLRAGMSATVEPIRPFSPEPFTARHRQEVAGIAITAHKGRPMIVSGALDSTAIVWDATTKEKRQQVLRHPSGVGVKCVAATGPLAAPTHLVATGGSDGRVRIWDLAKPDAIPETVLAEFEEGHGSAVNVVAFSPDGKSLATAAGREIFVWDIVTRKKKYSLPLEHLDDITALRFTPQCTLVTVARDKTARIYQLGTDAATLAPNGLLDHRSGAVDVLGLSADGGRMFFDQDATRMDIVSLSDQRTLGTLQNGGGVRFAGLALFSPDDKYAVTAAGDSDAKGEMQLWELPKVGSSGRGSERRRLVTPNRAAVTCAAFSPDPTHDWIAVGTQAGGVHFWSMATVAKGLEWQGVIVAITEVDSRSSMIRVEVNNPGGVAAEQLQDRGMATIIIDPMAPLKPLPAAVPPKLNALGLGTKPAPMGEIVTVGATQPVERPAVAGATYVVPALRTLPSVIVPPVRK